MTGILRQAAELKAVFYVVISVLIGWRGVFFLCGGTLRKGSWDYNRLLNATNLVRNVLHKPIQPELTDEDWRLLGWRHLGIALIILIVGLHALATGA